MTTRDPQVWYAIPSANPDKCRATLPAWREMGYKVAVLQNRHRADIPADIVAWSDHYPGWPGSINELCARIVPSSADIVVSGGDDILPDPTTPAHAIAREMLARFPDGFGVMQPQGDAFMGARHYCGSPWLGRGWIQRAYGGQGPMFAGYRHNWADNELYWVAACLHALWERPDLTQRHEHFTRTGEPKPDYWIEHVERMDRHDVRLFIARAWQGFPGHEPRGAHTPFDHALFERTYRGLAESYWVTRYGMADLAGPGERKMRDALSDLARRGRRAVALFGAGTHTRSLGSVLMDPPVPVVAIIDDDPRLAGTRLWNYPVISAREALPRARRGEIDAVVLSSNSREDELVAASADLAAAGVEVVRLYGTAVPHEAASAA